VRVLSGAVPLLVAVAGWIVVSRVRALGAAMASWLEELERREAVARESAAELRVQIEELTGRLAEHERVLSRLEITRETMTEILSGADRVMAPGAGAVEKDTGGADGGGAVATGGSPVGVRLMPSWSPGMEAGVLPRAYQDIVEVLDDAVRPMRAQHLSTVLGLPTDKSRVEGFRSKLKRLVEREWIREAEPGLFAARSHAGEPAGEPERAGRVSVPRAAGAGKGSRS
jgi:hypothetical protein